MTVIISEDRLAQMVNDGVENNPIVGVRSVYARDDATITSGGPNATRGLDNATYTYWSFSSQINSLAIELNSTATSSMAGIASHNIGSTGARVRPQYWDGYGWEDLAGDGFDPDDDQTIIWLFDHTTSDKWRMRVTGNDSGDAAIGVLFIGQEFQFPRRFYQGYNEARYPTNVELLANQTGPHVLGTSVLRRGSEVQWQIENLPESDMYTERFGQWVDIYNRGQGFFSAWRPADYETAYYGWRSGDPITLPNTGPRNFKSIDFRMRVFDD